MMIQRYDDMNDQFFCKIETTINKVLLGARRQNLISNDESDTNRHQ